MPKTVNPNTPMSGLDKLNIGCGAIAILLLAASLLGSYFAQLHFSAGVINGLHWTGLGFMVLYLLTLAILKQQEIKSVAGHKNTRGGLNIGIQVAAVIAILGVLNYIGSRHHERYDLTQNKAYSLSDQSKKVVTSLKDPVNVEIFIKKGDPSGDNLKHLWEEYAYADPDKLKLTVVDVDKDPVTTREAKITQYNSTLLTHGERKTTITGLQESDLTSALLKVTQDGQKVVYFLNGHGELQTAGSGRDGLSYAKDALVKQNYKVDDLSLFAKKDVPSDAAIVVIAGPTKPLMPQELDALGRYIDNGGKVFLSLQPQADAHVADFAKQYGIVIHDDLVLDPRMNIGDLASPVVQHFPYHQITNGLQAAFFTGTRSLGKADKLPAGVNITPIVESSADAWGKHSLMDRALQFEPGDTKGPVEIMMLAEKGKGKLLVSGNTNFMSNASYVNFNNGDLFLNSLNWMADQETLVSIPPKDTQPKTVDLMPWQYNGIFYGTVLLIPLVLLFGAGLVWWRRR